MRKSTWLLLVLALAAILLVAGCAPTGPAPTPPDENGEPTPPPADTAAPKVVKTMVSNAATATFPDRFKITIVFDEDIYSPCAEDAANWTIRLINSQRVKDNNIDLMWWGPQIVGKQIIMYARVIETGGDPVFTYALVPRGTFVLTPATLPTTRAGWSAALQDGIDEVQAIVDAVNALSDVEKLAFLEAHNAADEYDGLLLALNAAKVALNDTYATDALAITAFTDALTNLNTAFQALDLRAVVTGVTPPPTFPGLICSKEDADNYKKAFGKEITAADVITWTLSDNCTISDILGNSHCGYSDKACCVGPSCEECEECDLTTGVCK